MNVILNFAVIAYGIATKCSALKLNSRDRLVEFPVR